MLAKVAEMLLRIRNVCANKLTRIFAHFTDGEESSRYRMVAFYGETEL
jgi:hypothetical protein